MAVIVNPNSEANQQFDQVFSALGLSEKRYRQGKGYHGLIGGREAHVYLESVRVQTNPNVAKAYMGHKLSIYLTCEAHTRLAITWKESVRDWLGRSYSTTPMTPVPTPANWEALNVKALDIAWATELIKTQESSFMALAQRQDSHGMSGFYLQPQALNMDMFLPWEQISLETVDGYVSQLLAIAQAVEALAAPEPKVTETVLERKQRLRIPGFPWTGLGIFILVALLIAAMVAVLRFGTS